MAGSSGQQGRKMPVGRPFVKGQSGNPSGRAKGVADVQAAAQQYTDSALETLNYWASQREHASASVAAAQALLDRGHGKPTQPTELSGKNGGAIKTEQLIVDERVSLDDLLSEFTPKQVPKGDANEGGTTH